MGDNTTATTTLKTIDIGFHSNSNPPDSQDRNDETSMNPELKFVKTETGSFICLKCQAIITEIDKNVHICNHGDTGYHGNSMDNKLRNEGEGADNNDLDFVIKQDMDDDENVTNPEKDLGSSNHGNKLSSNIAINVCGRCSQQFEDYVAYLDHKLRCNRRNSDSVTMVTSAVKQVLERIDDNAEHELQLVNHTMKSESDISNTETNELGITGMFINSYSASDALFDVTKQSLDGLDGARTEQSKDDFDISMECSAKDKIPKKKARNQAGKLGRSVKNEAKGASALNYTMADHVKTDKCSRKSNTNNYCCVPRCYSDSRYDSTLHFHHIPKDETMRKQWIYNIRRDEGPMFNVNKGTVVCSKHFTQYDYSSWMPVRKRLKPGVVPSVFDWSISPYRQPSKRKILAPERHTVSSDKCPHLSIEGSHHVDVDITRNDNYDPQNNTIQQKQGRHKEENETMKKSKINIKQTTDKKIGLSKSISKQTPKKKMGLGLSKTNTKQTTKPKIRLSKSNTKGTVMGLSKNSTEQKTEKKTGHSKIKTKLTAQKKTGLSISKRKHTTGMKVGLSKNNTKKITGKKKGLSKIYTKQTKMGFSNSSTKQLLMKKTGLCRNSTKQIKRMKTGLSKIKTKQTKGLSKSNIKEKMREEMRLSKKETNKRVIDLVSDDSDIEYLPVNNATDDDESDLDYVPGTTLKAISKKSLGKLRTKHKEMATKSSSVQIIITSDCSKASSKRIKRSYIRTGKYKKKSGKINTEAKADEKLDLDEITSSIQDKPPLTKEKFVCFFGDCKKMFQMEDKFKEHLMEEIKCQNSFHQADSTFINAVSLTEHLKALNVSMVMYSCNYGDCHHMYSTFEEIKHHIQTQHSIFKFKCEMKGCNKFFKTKNELKSHGIVDHPVTMETQTVHIAPTLVNKILLGNKKTVPGMNLIGLDKLKLKPVDVPTGSKPVDVPTGSKPVDVPTGSKPVDVPTGSKLHKVVVEGVGYNNTNIQTQGPNGASDNFDVVEYLRNADSKGNQEQSLVCFFGNCKKLFQTKELFKEHLKEEIELQNSGKTNGEFVTVAKFTEHLQEMDVSMVMFSCNHADCHHMYPTLDESVTHVRKQHSVSQSKCESNDFNKKHDLISEGMADHDVKVPMKEEHPQNTKCENMQNVKSHTENKEINKKESLDENTIMNENMDANEKRETCETSISEHINSKPKAITGQTTVAPNKKSQDSFKCLPQFKNESEANVKEGNNTVTQENPFDAFLMNSAQCSESFKYEDSFENNGKIPDNSGADDTFTKLNSPQNNEVIERAEPKVNSPQNNEIIDRAESKVNSPQNNEIIERAEPKVNSPQNNEIIERAKPEVSKDIVPVEGSIRKSKRSNKRKRYEDFDIEPNNEKRDPDYLIDVEGDNSAEETKTKTKRSKYFEYFVCKKCLLTFTSKQELSEHKMCHRKIHKCDFPNCDYGLKFNSRKLLLEHRRTVHAPSEFQCKSAGCLETFTSKDELRNHVKGKHMPVMPKCRTTSTSRTFVYNPDDKLTTFDTANVTTQEAVQKKKDVRRKEDICLECDFPNCDSGLKFTSRKLLSDHRRTIHALPQFHCRGTHCWEVFTSYDELRNHVKGKHAAAMPECKTTSTNTPQEAVQMNKDKINDNLQVTSQSDMNQGGNIYVCKFKGCFESFSDMVECYTHSKYKHNNSDEKTKEYDTAYAISHEAAHINKEERIYNLHCDEIISDSEDSFKHSNKHDNSEYHDLVDLDQRKRIYVCKVKSCNETFNDSEDYFIHSKQHESSEYHDLVQGQCDDYLCQRKYCFQSFRTKLELMQHVEASHDLPTIFCDVCHASFQFQSQLQTHKTHYHNVTCDYCPLKFDNFRQLTNHLDIVHGQSGYLCQRKDCFRTFKTKLELKYHVETSHLEFDDSLLPYQCKDCNKGFLHKKNHVQHRLECPSRKRKSTRKYTKRSTDSCTVVNEFSDNWLPDYLAKHMHDNDSNEMDNKGLNNDESSLSKTLQDGTDSTECGENSSDDIVNRIKKEPTENQDIYPQDSHLNLNFASVQSHANHTESLDISVDETEVAGVNPDDVIKTEPIEEFEFETLCNIVNNDIGIKDVEHVSKESIRIKECTVLLDRIKTEPV